MAKGFDKTELKIVNSRLARLAQIPGVDIPKVLEELTAEVSKDVKAAAPVRSGNLRNNSIYRESNDTKAKIFVDTTFTETRPSSKRFNYGYTVEHGRAGRYKTTPYFYRVAEKALGKLVQMINNAVKDAAIKGK